MRFLSIILSFSLFLALSIHASALSLYSYRAIPNSAPFIIPVKEGESPDQAWTRYTHELSSNKNLMEVFPNGVPNFTSTDFKLLSNADIGSRALLMANTASDYEANDDRIKRFMNIMKRSGQTSYVLPIASDIGLSESEKLEFKALTVSEFPFLVAMGGDDVHPSFYGEGVVYSRPTSLERDRAELEFLKFYLSSGRGFVLSICRGHQLTAVALGYQLVQDIQSQIETAFDHKTGHHEIEFLKTKNGILQSTFPELKKLTVNSFHHESIRFTGRGPLELAAVASDGVVEAAELKNGRALLLQFHPEYMDNAQGDAIVKRAVVVKDQILVRDSARALPQKSRSERARTGSSNCQSVF